MRHSVFISLSTISYPVSGGTIERMVFPLKNSSPKAAVEAAPTRASPRLTDVVKGETNRAILNTWLEQYNFQRPFSLPPGTPKGRVNILRKAFKATLEDRQFLKEAKKSKLIITYVSGEKVEKFVDKIMAITPKAKESLQFLIIKKKKKKS